MRDVTRTYLELTAPEELRPAPPPAGVALVLERMQDCTPSDYRRLYAGVGEDFHWVDRRDWTDERLAEHLARPEVAVWRLRADGVEAGWFELVGHRGGAVEIGYFGLLPAFHGRGLGRWLLTECARVAWASGATRVWLHTCTLDAPAALPNYIARGFRPFHTEVYQAAIDR